MIVEFRGEKYRIHWPRKTPDKVYIRYGLWSAREPSTNWSTHEDEDGLSVYPAILDASGAVHIAPSTDVCPLVEGRLAFPVTGREVGKGSDDEPVLRGVKMLPYPLAIDTPH